MLFDSLWKRPKLESDQTGELVHQRDYLVTGDAENPEEEA